jgi:hypothetical protein
LKGNRIKLTDNSRLENAENLQDKSSTIDKMCTQHYTQVKYDCGHKTVYKDDFESCNDDKCTKVKDRSETDWISGGCPDCAKK